MKSKIVMAFSFTVLFLFCASASMAGPLPTHLSRLLGQKQKSGGLAVKASAHSVALTWTQGTPATGSTCPGGSGSTAITSNNVYRGTSAGSEGTTPYASVSPAAATYTDATVTAGTTYYYQVTALNCSGESAHSNEASATIPNALVPNAPTGLTGNAQ